MTVKQMYAYLKLSAKTLQEKGFFNPEKEGGAVTKEVYDVILKSEEHLKAFLIPASLLVIESAMQQQERRMGKTPPDWTNISSPRTDSPDDQALKNILDSFSPKVTH